MLRSFTVARFSRLFFFLLLLSGLGFTVAMAQPSTQATNITLSPAGVSWTPGNGTNKLVVISTGGGLFAPSNSTDYTASINADFALAPDMDLGAGVAKLVYGGTLNTVAVANLAASTFYTIKVYEFNSAGFLYNTTNAASNPVVSWYYINTGATTNYTVPAGVTGLYVQAWGGGGGGGIDNPTNNGAAGGGGGAYASSIVAVTGGSNHTVTIGVGGTGGVPTPTNGTAGGPTSFGSAVIALGGGVVNSGATGAPGGSGPGSTGTTKFSGGNGGNGGVVTTNGGGGGGSSATAAGNGVNGGDFSTTTGGTGGNGTDGDGGNGGNSSGATAQPGTFPGGGGGGRGDGNGNSGNGAGGLVIVTYAVPDPPSTPDLTTDTGSSATDNITNDNTPTFAGTAESGSTVTIISSVDGVVGSGTATGGNYSITVSTLASGAHNITATATNAMGNISAASPALAITIDTSAPAAPSVPDLTTDTGSSAADNLTNDNTSTFDGTAETGSTVTIISNVSGSVGTGTATAGNYSITTSALASGPHNITATATDVAGNTGAASAALAIIVDTTAPTVVLDDDHADAIVRDADNVTITATFTEANGIGGTPAITIGSVVTAQAMSGGPLIWTYAWNVPSGNDGAQAVSISATDAAGNPNAAATAGTGPTSYTIDNTAPTVVSANRLTPAGAFTNATSVIFQVIFDGSVTGVDAADFTPTVSGVTTGAITTVTGSGTTYDVTVPTIAGNGTLRLDVLNTATLSDVAGNSYGSDFTTGQVYTIDNIAPTVVLDDNHADAIVRDADNVTITATFTDANGISGTPTITIGSVVTAQNMSGGPLIWTYAWNVPSGNDGAQAVSISATDVAGNANAAPTAGTGQLSYTIDNTAPTATSLVRQTPATSPTNATSVTFRITFNENVSNVDLADFELNPTNTATGTLSGVTNPTPFTVYDVTANPVSGNSEILNLDIAAAQNITDIAGNPYVIAVIGGEQEYVIDNVAPVVSPNEMSLNLNGASAETIVFSLSEELSSAAGAVAGFTTSTGAIATAIYSGKGTTNTITLTSAADGQWTTGTTVSYTPGTLADLQTNPLAAIVNHVVIQVVVNLSAGDIAFTSFRSDDPNNFSFVLLKDISAGTQIKFTNNGWKSDDSFRTGEETMTWTADVDYFAGLEVTFTGDPYTASHGTMSGDPDLELSTSGDQILAYQGSAATPTFLAAIQFNASSWEANATNDQTSDTPTGLTASHYVLIGNVDNAAYNIPGGEITTGSVTALRTNINAVANWDTDNNPANVTFPTAGLTNFVLPPDLIGSPFSPANGAIVPGTLPNLSITYNDNVIAGSSTGSDIQLFDQTAGGTLIATWNVGTADVSFTAATVNINTGGSISLVDGHLYRVVTAKRIFLNADANGNTAITGTTWQFTADAVRPTVSSINRQTPSTTPSNATSVVFRVTFSEAMTAATVQAADFTVTQTNLNFGVLSVSQISPTVYDVTVPSLSLIAAGSNGTIRLDVDGGTATLQDVPGNLLNATFNTGQSYTIDHTAPLVTSITRKTPLTATTNATTVVYQVTFNEDIDHTTFTDADLTKTLSGVTVGAATITETSPGVFDVSLPSVSGNGTIRIDLLPAASINDVAGNDYNATFNTGEVYTIDQAAPTVSSINRVNTNPTNSTIVNFTVTFNESVTGVDVADFVLTTVGVTANINSVSGSGTTYNVNVNSVSGNGTLRLDVKTSGAGATIQDLVTNAFTAGFTGGQVYNVDQTFPTVFSVLRLDANPNNTSTVNFEVKFTESVTGVSIADFDPFGSATTGAETVGVAGSGDTYTVTVGNVTLTGLLGLTVLDDNTIQDAATNRLGGPVIGDGIYSAGEQYQIILPEPPLHVTAFLIQAGFTTTTSMRLTWTDAGGSPFPSGYLITVQRTGGTALVPTDGTPIANQTDLVANNTGYLNILPGTQVADFTNLLSGEDYTYKIYPFTNAGINIDYKIDGVVPTQVGSTPTADEVWLNNATPVEPANFPSTSTSSGTAVVNFRFQIYDGGWDFGADNASTKITQIKIRRNTTNDQIGNWNDALAGVELFDGSTTKTGTVDPSGNFVTFSGLYDGVTEFFGLVPDDNFKYYSLKLILKTSLGGNLPQIIDNRSFIFEMNNSDITLAPKSSTLNPLNDTNWPILTPNGTNRVNVVATQLDFSTNPISPVFVLTNVTATPAPPDNASIPVVRARDVNGNTDRNYSATLTISNAGTIPMSTTSLSMSLGVAAFSSSFQYQDDGNGTLTVTSATLAANGLVPAAAISAPVTVNYSSTSILTFGTADAQISSLKVNNPYEQVFDFNIIDDNGAGGDGSPTRFTQLTVTAGTGNDFTNWTQALDDTPSPGAILFDGSTFVFGTIAANTITFTGIDPNTLGFINDNASKNFMIWILLKDVLGGTLQDDIDNKNFVFEVLDGNILLNSLSSNFTGTANVNSGAGNIAVDVDATKLVFATNPFGDILVNKDISLQPPVPVVKAFDALNNRDRDYVTSLGIANGGSLTMSTNSLTVDAPAPNGGLYTFPNNFQYTSIGSGAVGNGTLTISAPGLISALSTVVTVRVGISGTITAGGGAEPATMSSLDDTAPEKVQVFDFTINDDPGSTPPDQNDGNPMLISQIRITQQALPNNSIGDWSQAIAVAELFDGINTITGTVNATDITFSAISFAPGAAGYIADNASKTYELRIYLKAALGGPLPNTIDGLRFGFEVLSSNITTDPTGTAVLGGENENSGSANQVTVVATVLNFTTPATATNASLNTNFAVVVQARDANANRDLDFNGDITAFSNTGGLTMVNYPDPAVVTNVFASGLFNFDPAFQYTSDGGGAVGAGTLSMTAGGISGTSVSITVLSSFESQVKGDPSYLFINDVNYVYYQATNIQQADITNGNGSYELARMLLSDGDADGIAGDTDGANTVLTSLTLGITNHGHIRRIALYDGGGPAANEIAEMDGSAFNGLGEITFSGLSITATDNLTTPISVRVSFFGTSAEITDNSLIRVSVKAAILGGGSQFRSNVGDIAGFPGGLTAPPDKNFIEILATKLDFTTQPGIFAGINEPVVTGIVKARDQFGLIDSDFNFAPSLSSPAAGIIAGPGTFIGGSLDLTGMQYSSTGLGKVTVTANGINSNMNNTVGGLSNVSTQCVPIDVIHVSVTHIPPGSGGVLSTNNIKGGTTGAVIFGFTFNPLHQTGAEPSLNGFSITFSDYYKFGLTYSLRDFKVVESPSASFADPSAVDIATFGGAIAEVASPTAGPGELDQLNITFPTPRTLYQGITRSYFLVADVDVTANISTPHLAPQLVDLGFGDVTNSNIVTTKGSATTPGGGIIGQEYQFASTRPPKLISSVPFNGQLNVNPALNQIDLTFDVKVLSFDGVAELYDRKTNKLIKTLTAINGVYNGNISTLNLQTVPVLSFGIPPDVILKPDSLYYLKIAQGSYNPITNTGTGISDEGQNFYGGISYNGTLYFKISSPNAPDLMATSQAFASNSVAVFNSTFDQFGTAHYLVLRNNPSNTTPTNGHILNPATYPQFGLSYVTHGSFAITQVTPNPQAETFAATLTPGATYDVWMIAQNDAQPTPIMTAAPYGGTAPFNPGAAGPTLQLVVPSVIVNSNAPTIKVCPNSVARVTTPIIIGETLNNDFAGGVQNFNILLPTGFAFNIDQPPTIILSGSDFLGVSPTYSFVNNTILNVGFTNTGSGSRDNIIITNFEIIASNSGAIAPIKRFAGVGLTSHPDNTVLATLFANPVEPQKFTNTYTTLNDFSDVGLSGVVVNVIPDNFNDPASVVTLIPLITPDTDYGASFFSGPGVTNDVLNLTGVALNNAFDITMTHTDLNGCVSEKTEQYLVYDHNAAIPILGTDACITNTAFPTGDSPSLLPSSPVLNYNAKAGFNLVELHANIPDKPGIASQVMYGPGWDWLIGRIPVVQPGAPAGYKNFKWDYTLILNAVTESGDTITVNPYNHDQFADTTQLNNRPYWNGGSLGLIEFTGVYRSSADAQLVVPFRQEVEIFVPPIPVIEVGGQSANAGATPIFCENRIGDIVINGFPLATAGVSTGYFVLFDSANYNPANRSASVIYNKEDGVLPVLAPTGFKDNSNGTANLTPNLFFNNYGTIRVEYTYQDNNSPCSGTGVYHIRVVPNPIAQFTAQSVIGPNTPLITAYCEDRQITFDATTSSGTIASYKWNFSDPNNITSTNPNEPEGGAGIADIVPHKFNQSAPYAVSLIVTSNYGCASQPLVQNISVGKIPVVDFTFLGISTADPITVTNTSTIGSASTVTDGFGQLNWIFDDGTIEPPVTSGFLNPLIHNYSTPAKYDVNLTVTSIIGCRNTLTKPIIVLPRATPTANAPYEETFDAGSGNWQTASLPIQLKSASPVKFSWTAANSIWKTTSASGTYMALERSALYSPSFDISQLARPMISFNSLVQLETSDGVVLEYSVDNRNVADPLKEWHALGQVGDGVDWFTDQNITAKPGSQSSKDLGWSGTSANWLESKHALVDEVGKPPLNGATRVVFRFALASAKQAIDNALGGFGINNVRIGNRTRIVLLENFKNLGDAKMANATQTVEMVESNALKSFSPGGVATSVVKINYHVAFPSRDPLNLDNAQDPGARALYYNISKTPRVQMDGDHPVGDSYFSQWGTQLYNVRSLKLADATITPTVTNNPDGSISIAVNVTALKDLGPKTLLNIALVEKSIDKTSLSQASLINTGELNFEYVLKKMLPTAAGTRFDQLLPNTQSRTFGPFNWGEAIPLYAPNDDLAIVIFLQDEDTKDIYQTDIIDLGNDPSIVTGIEDRNTSFNVYPIPADNEMMIELPEPAQRRTTLQMFDQLGRTVEQSHFEKGDSRKTVNTTSFAAGVYLIQVDSPKGVLRRKVMVTHKN